MDKGYPSIEETKKIILSGAAYKKKVFNVDVKPYLEHSEGVADAAKKIASETTYLNPEKAYVLGLLHDYGHRILERQINKFHGKEGYEEMISMGYKDVARVCLTHTFPNKDFDIDSTGYPVEWMKWAKILLQDIQDFDDYDKLIQLCDKIHEDGFRTTIEDRVLGISKRYKLTNERVSELLEEGLRLKAYFDRVCGKDIYEILEIDEAQNVKYQKYPSLEVAKEIIEDILKYREENFPHRPLNDGYLGHIQNVALSAKKIAEATKTLIPEKAYVLGLLHDCGKRKKESEAQKFHGREGYEYMLEQGYPDVARISLTHTFPNKDFDIHSIGYPIEWMEWVKSKLKYIEYDDYDRLIQLCDKISEGQKIVKLEDRVAGIIKRYNLSEDKYNNLLKDGIELKNYFDNICGQDIYKIIGLV